MKWVVVNDRMQNGYRYALTAGEGRNFHPEFKPELTPKDMLALGVFGGKYMTDTQEEFPASWFAQAKLSPERSNPKLNYSGSPPANHSPYGNRKAGFIRTIRAAGSNGIAAITADGGTPKKTCAKSSVGKP